MTDNHNTLAAIVPEATMRLIKEVVQLEPEKRSIDEWADDLSKDISKPND
jgi:hypothetical protein